MSTPAAGLPRGYEGVAVAVPVTVPYQKTSPHGAAWFIGQALARLIEGAGIAKADIDGLAVSSFTLAPDTSVALTEQFGMSPRWLEWLPTGGASGVMALRRAARAIQCGDAEIVACIAGDTNQPGAFTALIERFSNASMDAVYPYGGLGPNGVFAMITRHYMERFGATRADFGRLCVAQRHNASHFAHALLKKPLSLEDYLAARPVAEPIHLFDCVMPCAGADAFLVMSEDRARHLGLPYATVAGAIERHNAYADDPVAWRGGWAMDADQLYAQAGVGPADVDLVETYDDYPVIAFLQLEDLGFCAKGEAARLIAERPTTWDGGGLPHNTSGGQLSAGQAGAAGGFLGLVEALRQLTGQALGNPVAGAHRALVSGYGMVIHDRCLCTAATILEAGWR